MIRCQNNTCIRKHNATLNFLCTLNVVWSMSDTFRFCIDNSDNDVKHLRKRWAVTILKLTILIHIHANWLMFTWYVVAYVQTLSNEAHWFHALVFGIWISLRCITNWCVVVNQDYEQNLYNNDKLCLQLHHDNL